MGITAIKRIENRSRSTVMLFNRAREQEVGVYARGANIPIAPGSSIAADMWIPWAPAAADFPIQHLEISQGGVTRYWIWQAANADGDFIRFSTDGKWHDQGEKVHGYPGVATNIVEAIGGALFTGALQPLANMVLGERAIVVLDSHFETIPISPKPLQIPFTTIKRIENLSTRKVRVFRRNGEETSWS